MFRQFSTTALASFRMLTRNGTLIASTLFLGAISIMIFGWLFGAGNQKIVIGIANTDTTAYSTSIIHDVQNNDALSIKTGSQASELQALHNGQRDAVLIMDDHFGANLAQGKGTMTVYYNQTSTTTLAITRSVVGQIVAGINQSALQQPPVLTVQEQTVSARNLRTIDYLTPGMVGMMLMWANMTVGITLVNWRQQGILKRLAATPMLPFTLVSSQMLARLVLSLAQAGLLLVLAALLFHVQVVGSWFAVIMTVATGALAMLAIGFAIGSFVPRSESAQTIANLIGFPMMFLSGSYFSVAGAPDFLRPVINALPLTHINDALRDVINNGASLGSVQNHLLILAAWIVAGMVLAVRAFRWS